MGRWIVFSILYYGWHTQLYRETSTAWTSSTKSASGLYTKKENIKAKIVSNQAREHCNRKEIACSTCIWTVTKIAHAHERAYLVSLCFGCWNYAWIIFRVRCLAGQLADSGFGIVYAYYTRPLMRAPFKLAAKNAPIMFYAQKLYASGGGDVSEILA